VVHRDDAEHRQALRERARGVPSSPVPMSSTLFARSSSEATYSSADGGLIVRVSASASLLQRHRSPERTFGCHVGRGARRRRPRRASPLGDRVLQVRIAAIAELLAELHHAGLADAERRGELLRGVVAHQLRVVEDEVGDAAFDRRHLLALRAMRSSGAVMRDGSRPRIWRMPRPGASVDRDLPIR
jgi:hypothetical protein